MTNIDDVSADLTVLINSVALNASDFNMTCGDTATPFEMYIYSAGSTPTIESVTERAVVGDSLNLVLNGLSEIPEDNVFVFGGQTPVACMSSNFSSETEPLYSMAATMRSYLATAEYECIVPDIPPGAYRTLLHVAGKGWGYARLDSSVVHVHPRIEAVSETSGSLRGGTSLTLQMTGISPSDIAGTRVHIGNTPCPVQSISSGGQLVCTTQAAQDDGYSSIVNRDSPLAHWTLQADYYRGDGSYVESDGEHWFRSGGTLGIRANASVSQSGVITTQQRGISNNNVTDQSAFFQSAFIQTPALSEFSQSSGFAMDLWVKVPQTTENYQVVVDASDFVDNSARGFVLMLNPCSQLEFWIATATTENSTNSSSQCEVISDTSNCPLATCSGYLDVPVSESALPSGVWHVLRTEYRNLSSWQYVHYGWSVDSNLLPEYCERDEQCYGLQVLHINNFVVEERTTYLPSHNSPISIGGSNVLPFTGYLDEVAFYNKPLESKQVHTRVQYGISESQPIWVTVNGVDGVGRGSVPNLAYQDLDQTFTNETVINWDTAQELSLDIQEATAIVFEWTGYVCTVEIEHLKIVIFFYPQVTWNFANFSLCL